MNEKMKRFVLNKEVLFQRFGKEAILVNLDDETIYQLNETGARIAELLVKERSVRELLTILDQEFNKNSSIIEWDVLTFLEGMLSHELVVEPQTPNQT